MNGERIRLPLDADALAHRQIFYLRGDGKGRVLRNFLGKPVAWPKDWFVGALNAAAIQNFHWHDLRHTFTSRLRQKGVPLGNIAELLGHKGLAMTKRYAHLSVSNLHEAVARIASPTGTTTDSEVLATDGAHSYVN